MAVAVIVFGHTLAALPPVQTMLIVKSGAMGKTSV